ncbi:MAG: ErfK/YbiS/YcfS/YnhG family protein [Clostridia bacterium]|nr:ErfK/YbiS/YcfS/YnhG family protein [Clostridia bacterium]
MYRFIIAVLILSFIFTGLYIPEAVYADPILPNRLLSLGSQGLDVITVQEALNQLGYSLKTDGIYGLETKQAILHFQRNYPELPNDGVYGPNTSSYLSMALTENQDVESGQAQSEENVNENLNEDKALTYNAEIKGLTNTISQSFIETNRSKLIDLNINAPIIKEWNTKLPEDLPTNIKYNQYAIAYDYFLVTTNSLNVRALPTTESDIVKKIRYFDKVNIIQEVQGQYLASYASDSWFRIFWHENGTVRYGFVFSKLGEPRSFRFHEMHEEIKILQKTIEENKVGYIYNYKNIKGFPPAYQGDNIDGYGNSRSQSAPGYVDFNKSDFRYFPDGMLVAILAEDADYYKVSTPMFEGEYFIPKKYISFRNAPEQLKKVIVIDDLNQNEGVFEWSSDHWELISYIYATTGVNDTYSYETPKGHFMAVEKKPSFLYLEDGTSRISGFAPYAVRFSGGGYIHGVPIDFKLGQNQYNTDPANPINHEEYLFTIGTTPRSHKCVRNFTSHAKFLYEWAEIGSTAVIVIN